VCHAGRVGLARRRWHRWRFDLELRCIGEHDELDDEHDQHDHVDERRDERADDDEWTDHDGGTDDGVVVDWRWL